MNEDKILEIAQPFLEDVGEGNGKAIFDEVGFARAIISSLLSISNERILAIFLPMYRDDTTAKMARVDDLNTAHALLDYLRKS